MPFVFPDLPDFATIADLTSHLRSIDTSFRAACTTDHLAERCSPPPYLTLHFLATRLPDRLVSSRDALLAMHPMNLTIELFATRLTEIETHLCTIASTTGTVVPPIFEGCAPPQFPKPAASIAVSEPTASSEAAIVSAPSGGRGRRRGGRVRGGGGGAGTTGGADAGSTGFGVLPHEVLVLAMRRCS
ncbi:unnamed protein product [Closterium sp. NIES-53]